VSTFRIRRRLRPMRYARNPRVENRKRASVNRLRSKPCRRRHRYRLDGNGITRITMLDSNTRLPRRSKYGSATRVQSSVFPSTFHNAPLQAIEPWPVRAICVAIDTGAGSGHPATRRAPSARPSPSSG
jgi:hypothetical protein